MDYLKILKIIAFLLLLRSLYYLFISIHIRTNWLKIQGKVIEAKKASPLLKGGAYYKITVQYYTDSQNFTNDFTIRRTFFDDRPIIGATETIYYDPYNPENARTKRDIGILLILKSLKPFIVVIILFFYLKFYLNYLSFFLENF